MRLQQKEDGDTKGREQGSREGGRRALAVRERGGGDATARRWRRTLAHAAAADDNDFVQNLLLLLAHCVLVRAPKPLPSWWRCKNRVLSTARPLLYSLHSSQRFTTHPSRFAGRLQRQTPIPCEGKLAKLWRLLRQAARLPQIDDVSLFGWSRDPFADVASCRRWCLLPATYTSWAIAARQFLLDCRVFRT